MLQRPESIKLEIDEKFLFTGFINNLAKGRMQSNKCKFKTEKSIRLKIKIKQHNLSHWITNIIQPQKYTKRKKYLAESKFFNRKQMLTDSFYDICDGNFLPKNNPFNGFLIFRKVR